MKKILFVLLLVSTPVLADPFNIYLPFNTQYAPESLGKFKKAFIVDYEEGGDNFQLQLAPVTGVEQFIDTRADHDLVLGFMIGLGGGFEFEINTRGDSSYSSLKYSMSAKESLLTHSFLIGSISSASTGHGGALLQEDDCGFFDFLCFLDDFFTLFGSSSETYEYEYRAELSGVMFGYLQGYQYSKNIMPYWGAYYVDYDIDYEVVDNTGSGADQKGNVDTDLMYLTLGARINAGETDSKGEQSVWLVNYVIYKDSRSHSGDLDGELRFSYINKF